MMISAKNVTPSISAAAMIIAVWMFAGDLGLPGHALDGRLGQHADAHGRADDDQAGTDGLEVGEGRMHAARPAPGRTWHRGRTSNIPKARTADLIESHRTLDS